MQARTAMAATLAALSIQSVQLWADHIDEEVLVSGSHDRFTVSTELAGIAAADSAAALRKLPGASSNNNGPLTGIQQYRGMFGNRVDVAVDGMHITSGGPNLMDPPLHYAPGSTLESITLYRGIAPVSVAQEAIGGAIVATSNRGAFGNEQSFGLNGYLNASGQTVNDSWLGNGLLALSNKHHKLYLSGLSESGNDARFPKGSIRPSAYQRERIAGGYAWQAGNHQLEFSAVRSTSRDAGTPALPMDISHIDGDLYRGEYQFRNAHWALEASLHANEVDHGMSNNQQRPAPPMTMRYRDNATSSRGQGYSLVLERYTSNAIWRLGSDGQRDLHNSDISNPTDASFFVVNFNDSQRQVLGVFGETEWRLGSDWELSGGLRVNQVRMDSDEVSASMAMMMPGVRTLMQRFNSADRSSDDRNIDWLLRANWNPIPAWTITAALARKSRSAAYQEKFLWLPLQSAGGLADGNNYIGDLDLKPEVAHEVELGFDWQSNGALLSPRFFYRHVDNYIQGVPSTNAVANAVSQMMSGSDPLQFANVEARLYGMDMNWRAPLSDAWSLYGIVNYIRGEREDIDDDLYRIAPPNTTIGLRMQQANWEASVETLAYMRQNHVSDTNGEGTTPGHAILNLAAQWNIRAGVTLGLGIDNVLNREYRDHLNGVNRAVNNDIAVGEKLPGWGRNAYARLRWEF